MGKLIQPGSEPTDGTLNFKVSCFYESQEGNGWSENFFINNASYQGALTLAQGLMATRASMLTQFYYILAIRVSDDFPGTRDSVLYVYDPPLQGSNTTLLLESNIYTAVLARFDSGATGQNRHFLHGLADGDFSGTHWQPSPSTTVAFDNFRNHFIAAGEGWKNRFTVQKGIPFIQYPVYAYRPVTSIEYVRVISRRVGRPFGSLRGRRRRIA